MDLNKKESRQATASAKKEKVAALIGALLGTAILLFCGYLGGVLWAFGPFEHFAPNFDLSREVKDKAAVLYSQGAMLLFQKHLIEAGPFSIIGGALAGLLSLTAFDLSTKFCAIRYPDKPAILDALKLCIALLTIAAFIYIFWFNWNLVILEATAK